MGARRRTRRRARGGGRWSDGRCLSAGARVRARTGLLRGAAASVRRRGSMRVSSAGARGRARAWSGGRARMERVRGVATRVARRGTRGCIGAIVARARGALGLISRAREAFAQRRRVASVLARVRVAIPVELALMRSLLMNLGGGRLRRFGGKWRVLEARRAGRRWRTLYGRGRSMLVQGATASVSGARGERLRRSLGDLRRGLRSRTRGLDLCDPLLLLELQLGQRWSRKLAPSWRRWHLGRRLAKWERLHRSLGDLRRGLRSRTRRLDVCDPLRLLELHLGRRWSRELTPRRR